MRTSEGLWFLRPYLVSQELVAEDTRLEVLTNAREAGYAVPVREVKVVVSS